MQGDAGEPRRRGVDVGGGGKRSWNRRWLWLRAHYGNRRPRKVARQGHEFSDSGHAHGDRRVPLVLVFVLARVRPGDDLEAAVGVLADRRAAFHPVAAVDVVDAEILMDRGVVDVAADHA